MPFFSRPARVYKKIENKIPTCVWVGYERTKYANVHFASHVCIDSYSEMNIGET